MSNSNVYQNDIESNFEEYDYEPDYIAIDIKPEYISIDVKPITKVPITKVPITKVPITKIVPTIKIVQPINLQIKTATGKIFIINIIPHETILCLKKKIYMCQDVSLDSQKIIYGGKQLEDHKRICDYNITNESVVHIVLRLRGGMFHKSSSRADWISLNYLDKMERGLSMLDYLKRGITDSASDKLFIIYEDLEDMLNKSRDDDEIDMIYELIRNIYID
jgi:hypothetical protein